MAGVRTLEELLKIAPDLYEITVFGAEPHPNYNRILLSPVLAGEQTMDQIVLNPLRLVRRQRHHAARRQEGDRGRPHQAPRARRRRHRGALRPAAAGHRLEPLHPAGAGQGPARRDRLPRHRRHRGDDRRRQPVQARGRHRRRPARAGGRQRPDAARHAGDGGARRALADGAPARRGGRQAAAEVARGTRPALPDRRADAGAGRRRRRPRRRACASRTAASCRPTWW